MIRCFPEPLDTRRVPYRDGREVALLADFPMCLPIGVEIRAKKGFVSDGASIPEFFRRVIGCPFAGAYVLAAIPHDVLYAAEALPREVCDAVFKIGLQDLADHGELPSWKVSVMYGAVRFGGWGAWTQHTEPSKLLARKFLEISTSAHHLEKLLRECYQ